MPKEIKHLSSNGKNKSLFLPVSQAHKTFLIQANLNNFSLTITPTLSSIKIPKSNRIKS